MDEKVQFDSHCPECDALISFAEKPELNLLLVCPDCHTRLEVVQDQPLKLDWAFIASFDERSWANGHGRKVMGKGLSN